MSRAPIAILLAATLAAATACSSSSVGTRVRTAQGPPGYRQVSWPEAQRLIRACETKVVGQTHRRLVSLTLRDGSKVFTHEPAIDDVIREVNRLSRKCRPTQFWTE